ncbi:MAG: acyltransferase family protein [Phycisphaerales bacterium]
MTTEYTKQTRRHDLDWLRIGLFALLIVVHNALGFTQFGDIIYGYSNGELGGKFLDVFLFFTHGWRLPALFIISGMGTCFAFKYRSSLQFVWERITRLFIPLLFGSLCINVIHGYFRFVNDGGDAPFFDFVISWWTEPDPIHIGEAGFGISQVLQRVGHLWFLVNLLIYTLVALPLFVLFRRFPNNIFATMNKTINRLPLGIGLLLLFPIPLVLIELFLKPWMPGFIGTGYEFFWYFLFFVMGYLFIAAGEVFWQSLHKLRFAVPVLACLTTSGSLIFIGIAESISPGYGFLLESGGWVAYEIPFWNWLSFPMCILHALNAWWWSLSIFAWGAICLNRASKYLSYMNQAVYPFYILHMTLCLVGLYYVRELSIPWFAKFMLLNVIVFVGCWVLFEVLRRTPMTRVLLGIKRMKD